MCQVLEVQPSHCGDFDKCAVYPPWRPTGPGQYISRSGQSDIFAQLHSAAVDVLYSSELRREALDRPLQALKAEEQGQKGIKVDMNAMRLTVCLL